MSEKIKKKWQTIKEKSEGLDLGADAFDLEEEDEGGSGSGTDGALDHPSYQALEEKLTLAEQQAHENWEKSVRAIAELDNVRRRAEREVSNAHRYGVEKLVSSLLPVVDSLEQALQLVDKQGNSAMHEGIELTMKLFLDALEKCDVQQSNPVGEMFDPQRHEAMSMQESADTPANTVLTVFQKGYLLNDRVIRPARVIVSKAKAG